MSENVHLTVTQLNLEKLRCSLCNGYLSCAPIRLLPDGSNICGHCSPTDDALTYRQLTLEAILSDAQFPCKFKQFGCTKRLSFGHGSDHEVKCRHRTVPCVSLPFTSCTWDGPLVKISEHFKKDHNDLVKAEAEFNFNVENSTKGITMVVNGDGAFIVTYEYEKDERSLNYVVRHFLSNVDDVFCKVRLTNESDPDYSLQVKGGKCFAFSEFTTVDGLVLSLDKYLDNLNNPEDVVVKLSIDVSKSKVNNDVDVEEQELTVDYSVLEALRCGGCQYYLVPPTFYLRPNIICYECSKTSPDCPLSYNRRIQSLMSEAIYPCRWLDCNFVAKCDGIREHEIRCKFRLYRCLLSCCNATIKPSSIIDHLKIHNCRNFVDQFAYKTNLNKSSDKIDRVYAVVKNEIVLIELSTKTLSCCENAHYLSIVTSSFNPSQFNLSVQFGHNHCRCKSKKFCFKSMQTVRFSDLPQCFEYDDDLSAVLKIESS